MINICAQLLCMDSKKINDIVNFTYMYIHISEKLTNSK